MSNKQYVYLIILIIVAFILVVLRSYSVGVQWNPLGFTPKTRVGQLLPEPVQYLLMLIIIIVGIALAVYLERRTRAKRQS
jgi:hypothetical protein